MDKLKKLLAQKMGLVAEANGIQKRAKSEGRELTIEEAETINAKMDEAEALDSAIAAARLEKESVLAAGSRAEAAAAQMALPGRSRTLAGEDLNGGPEASGARVEVGQDRRLLDPKRGYASPRAFLMDVLNAGRGRGVSEMLRPLAAVGSDEHAGFSDPDGGFLVPVGFSPDLLKIQSEADPIGGLTTKVPMATPTLDIPARVDKNHTTSVSGGLRFYRRNESGEATASKMQVEKVSLKASPLTGLSYATEEILQDSAVSFIAMLEQGFGEQFIAHMINERLRGTGVGEYLGILNSPCLVSQSAEGGQSADTIVYANLIKMRARVWGYGKAIWLANPETLSQLMTIAYPSSGVAPIWQPSLREDHPDMLLGRPIIFNEHLSAIGDVGDIVCANWSQYLEAMYEPMQSAESVHVRFVYNERAFRFNCRNAGAPWWSAALTPAKGASTLSPFVTLAAR